MRKYFLSLVIFLSLSIPLLSFAQENVEQKADLEIAPESFDFELAPGDSSTKVLRIYNLSSEKRELDIDLLDFKSIIPASKWIKTESKVLLDPEEKKELEIEVAIPEGVGLGERKAFLILKEKDEEKKRILINIFVSDKSRSIIEKGKVTEVNTQVNFKKIFQLRPSLSFNYQWILEKPEIIINFGFKNIGNTYLLSSAISEISCNLGIKKITYPKIKLAESLLEPNEEKVFTAKLTNGPLFGFCKAENYINYGKGKLIKIDTSFIVWNSQLIFFALFVLLILIVGIAKLIGLRRRKTEEFEDVFEIKTGKRSGCFWIWILIILFVLGFIFIKGFYLFGPLQEPEEEREQKVQVEKVRKDLGKEAEKKVFSSEGIYIVKEGDTLAQIAEKFNLTLEEIMELNNISDPNLIYIGQELKVKKEEIKEEEKELEEPEESAEGNVYIVKEGDTLVLIGEKFKIDWREIAKLNNIEEPYEIYIGQKLYLPKK